MHADSIGRSKQASNGVQLAKPDNPVKLIQPALRFLRNATIPVPAADPNQLPLRPGDVKWPADFRLPMVSDARV
jgi:hypothetical protein